MKKCQLAAFAAFFAAPAMALAASNSVDLYYVPSADLEVDIEDVGSDSIDGDGFGVKGVFSFTDVAFFTGEYQAVEYDDDGGDLDQLRLGAGYRFPTTGLPSWYARAEFIQLDDGDESQNGYGLHGGVRGENGALGIFAEAGYVDVSDAGDGFEFTVGGDFAVAENFAIFADYRYTDLSADGGADITVKDLRLGLRLRF